MAELTEIERIIIDKVREMRQDRNMSQLELSQRIGVNDSFVGQVERVGTSEKYNIRHLNEIAKVLKCSLWDLIPEQPV